MKRNILTVTGSTLSDAQLHVSEITFDKEEVNIGDTLNISAKIEGVGTVKEVRLQLSGDNHNDQRVWEHEVILKPDEEGNVTGSLRIDPTDTYWKKGVGYGIAAIHLLDSENSSRFYADNVDAEVMDDLRSVKFNRFTVDTYSAPTIEPADYSSVDTAIDSIPEDLTLYTDESVKALLAARDAVVRDKTELEQLVVNSYATTILSAISSLELKEADYSEVDAAIASIPETMENYTDESVKALRTAVDAVVREKLITEQNVVDDFADSINAALRALELKPADYTKVDEAKEAVPEDLSIYTEESVATLKAALDSVLRDKKITEQNIVDEYAEKILAAIEGLEKKPEDSAEVRPADYSKVDKAIYSVPDDLDKYTDESVKALEAAIGAVIRGKDITEQAAVDTYARDILDAIKALKEKETSVSKPETKSSVKKKADAVSAVPYVPTTAASPAAPAQTYTGVAAKTTVASSVETGDKTSAPLFIAGIASAAGLAASIFTLRRRKK